MNMHLLQQGRQCAFIVAGRPEMHRVRQAWYREGESAKALQQWEDAAQAYYQAFTLDPSNTDVAHAFQHAIAQGKAEYAARQAGS